MIYLAPTDKKTLKRFWSKVDIKGEDECWLWIRGTTSAGAYGDFIWDKRHWRANRFSLLLKLGSLSSKRMALHTCDVSLCCNPKHLYAGNQTQNMTDASIRGRATGGTLSRNVGSNNGKSKLTWKKVNKIRLRASNGEDWSTIIVDYPYISRRTIQKVISNSSWVLPPGFDLS